MPEYYWYTSEPNPKGPKTGSMKVVRGGSWDSNAWYLRVTLRGKNPAATRNSNVGFRCVISEKDVK
jgi:iron(II)-dependent oxidoreductase